MSYIWKYVPILININFLIRDSIVGSCVLISLGLKNVYYPLFIIIIIILLYRRNSTVFHAKHKKVNKQQNTCISYNCCQKVFQDDALLCLYYVVRTEQNVILVPLFLDLTLSQKQISCFYRMEHAKRLSSEM